MSYLQKSDRIRNHDYHIYSINVDLILSTPYFQILLQFSPFGGVSFDFLNQMKETH